MFWENRIVEIVMFISFFFSTIVHGEDKIFLNHTVSINNSISSRFTKKPISGIIYRSFKNQNLKPKLVAKLSLSIKTGPWTGWWDSGKPKYHG